MPVLKKAYPTYGEVAGKTVQYLLYDLLTNASELKAETLGSACFINDGKGNFSRIDLPDELQLAPVFAFASIPAHRPQNFLAGGNFSGVIPYEGKYDALFPTLFSATKGNSPFETRGILPDLKGEVRDLKWIHTARFGDILAVARNNDSLAFFKYNP